MANERGFAAGDVYFTAPWKSEKDIHRVIGKCRIVADSLDELHLIDQASMSVLGTGNLEPAGVRLVLEEWGGPGIGLCGLPALSRGLRGLTAVSIRGCFVQREVSGLHGKALGRYFRDCFEAAKRMSATIPCGIAFLCVTGGEGAARYNMEKHPETLPEFRQAADIVAAQNCSAFYAKLLIS